MAEAFRPSRATGYGCRPSVPLASHSPAGCSALAADAKDHPEAAQVRHPAVGLNGGPATIDLWDLKPGHANGGPFKEIETAATGCQDQREYAQGREADEGRGDRSLDGEPKRAITAARDS